MATPPSGFLHVCHDLLWVDALARCLGYGLPWRGASFAMAVVTYLLLELYLFSILAVGFYGTSCAFPIRSVWCNPLVIWAVNALVGL